MPNAVSCHSRLTACRSTPTAFLQFAVARLGWGLIFLGTSTRLPRMQAYMNPIGTPFWKLFLSTAVLCTVANQPLNDSLFQRNSILLFNWQATEKQKRRCRQFGKLPEDIGRNECLANYICPRSANRKTWQSVSLSSNVEEINQLRTITLDIC